MNNSLFRLYDTDAKLYVINDLNKTTQIENNFTLS